MKELMPSNLYPQPERMSQPKLIRELNLLCKQSVELQNTTNDLLPELKLNRELLQQNTDKIHKVLLLIDNGDAETAVQ